MKHARFIRIAASCLALSAVAAPAASARTDIGPPPAPSAHSQSDAVAAYEGLQLHRSGPVTAVARPHSPAVDLRSPDARDAARGVSVAAQTPAATASKSDDTDWGKIGAIAGSALGGLMLVGLGFVFTRRTTVLQR